MNIDISIVVLTFNQKNTVLQSLESIKYQIENYRKIESIQLIISDDGSTDGTQNYIERWIEKNDDLFAEIDKLYFKKNHGICKNIEAAFQRIKGDHILMIAGDDLLMNTNVLKKIQKVQADEIVACPPLIFRGRHILKDDYIYYNSLIAAFFNNKSVARRAQFSTSVTNGSLFGKNYFDKYIYAATKHVVLLDDWMRLIRYFEKWKKYNFYFCLEPVYLYRTSDAQVTSKCNSVANKRMCKDDIWICNYVLKNTKDPSIRIRIRMRKVKLIKPKLYKIVKYLNLETYLDFFLYRVIHKKKISEMKKKLIQYGEKHMVEQYLSEIIARAKRYFPEEQIADEFYDYGM